MNTASFNSALSGLTIAGAIERFLFHCRYEKNLDPKTLKAYAADLGQFAAFVAETGNGAVLGELTTGELKQYVKRLSIFRPRTVKRKMASLKAMLNLIELEDDDFRNPMRKLRIRIKAPSLLPSVMSIGEIGAILSLLYRAREHTGESAANTSGTSTSYRQVETARNIAVLELLFGTGLRVSELCSLKQDSIDLETGYIRVYGKGGKERIVPIQRPEILCALGTYERESRRYKEEKRCAAPEQGGTGSRHPGKQETINARYFFVNKRGRGLSAQSVRQLVKKLAHAAGLGKHVTPHTFRHTFATLLLEEGVDIKYIQNILGHSSLVTTQIYTHVRSTRQKTILSELHPRRHLIIQKQ